MPLMGARMLLAEVRFKTVILRGTALPLSLGWFVVLRGAMFTFEGDTLLFEGWIGYCLGAVTLFTQTCLFAGKGAQRRDITCSTAREI